MNLASLRPGQKGRIAAVGGDGALRRHLLDMGLTPGTPVLIRKVAPMGDPIELCLRRYELTLRREEAEKIEILEDSVWIPCNGSCKTCKAMCGTRKQKGFGVRKGFGRQHRFGRFANSHNEKNSKDVTPLAVNGDKSE
jgi:Fe2+ transport system protein FeoA